MHRAYIILDHINIKSSSGGKVSITWYSEPTETHTESQDLVDQLKQMLTDSDNIIHTGVQTKIVDPQAGPIWYNTDTVDEVESLIISLRRNE